MRATLAATLAVGLGVALAKAGRGRLAAHRGTVELGLGREEPLEQGLRRMAIEQLELASEQLAGGPDGAPDERAVHETRKALKRLRALLRLLEPALGEQALASETSALREVAARLGGARDAEVMLGTLEGLLERHPKLARTHGVGAFRAQLRREHERMRAQTLHDPAARALAQSELAACRSRVEAWALPAGAGPELLAPGLRRIYGQGRKRFRRAASSKGEEMTAMHQWRKRVKDLRYVAEMLERREGAHAPTMPGPAGKRERRRRKQARAHAQLLHKTASRADDLGEALGEDHDLAVLARIVHAHGRRDAQPRLRRRARKRLCKAIAQRRHDLHVRALKEGKRLYARSPKRFLRRWRAVL